MKKLLYLVIVSLMILCFSACKDGIVNENSDIKYTYLPKTELHTHQNSSGFYREYKNTYKYDSYGNIIKKVKYTKGTFYVRETQYDIEYNYNDNGDITKELIRIEEFSTSLTDGHHIYKEGYNYFYNESQQLIKKENINPSVFVGEFCGYTYEYDENGNRVKEYRCFSDDTKELEFECEYDLQNKLVKKQYIANSPNLSYVANETDYTYDDGGRLVYSKTTHYDHLGEKSHYIVVEYHYDQLDRLVKEEKTSFDNDGKIKNKDVRKYKNFIRLELKSN